MKMTLPSSRILKIEISELNESGEMVERIEKFTLNGYLETLTGNGMKILEELQAINVNDYTLLRRAIELAKDYVCTSLSDELAIEKITGKKNATLDLIIFVITAIMQELNEMNDKENEHVKGYLSKKTDIKEVVSNE